MVSSKFHENVIRGKIGKGEACTLGKLVGSILERSSILTVNIFLHLKSGGSFRVQYASKRGSGFALWRIEVRP